MAQPAANLAVIHNFTQLGQIPLTDKVVAVKRGRLSRLHRLPPWIFATLFGMPLGATRRRHRLDGSLNVSRHPTRLRSAAPH